MSCPFINKELLSRLPEDKKEELERYYKEFVQKKDTQVLPEQQCPVLQLDEEKVDTEQPISNYTKLKGNNGPAGACPFLASQHTDPAIDFFEVGWNIKYKKKHSHFLKQRVILTEVKEEAKVNQELFDEAEEKKFPKYKKTVLTKQELKEKQKILREYPPVLLNTLFHDESKYRRYRRAEFSNLFFFSDEIKTMGNDAFQKNNFYLALDFYEQCITMFNWLELKDEDNEKKKLSLFGKEPVVITDDKVFNLFKNFDEDSDEVLEKENLLSMIINLIKNAYVCYMKLFHYKDAKNCALYILKIKPDYPKSFLFLGQIAYYNKGSTCNELREAIKEVEEGIKMASLDIAYQDDLRNLNKILELLQSKLSIGIKKDVTNVEKIILKAQKVYLLRKEKGLDLFPAYNNVRTHENFKLVKKMHIKYFDVLEYFRESQMPKEAVSVIQEFQRFDETYQQMNYLLNQLNFKKLDKEVLKELPTEVQEILQSNDIIVQIANDIKDKLAYEEFENSKHINIQMMQYAMELIDKEDKRERKLKEKLMKENIKDKGIGGMLMSAGAHMAFNLLIFLIILVIWLYFRDDIYKYLFDSKKGFK